MAYIQSEIASSFDGFLLEISLLPDVGTSGPGTFYARTRAPGEVNFSAAFLLKDSTGTALHSDGSGFGFDKAAENPDRWMLTMVVVGDSSPSVWWSSDEGITWTRS